MNMVSLPETINSPILYFLDVGILLGGLGVVFFGKIIYSALFLGVVFVCVALLYLLLNADFLAAAQILIYVGAINVLIVFAIMLINKPETKINKKKITFGDILSGFSVFGLFSFLIIMILNTTWLQPTLVSQEVKNSFQSIDIIGIHLLTDLLLPFELLSILLLVALVGAITIARKEISPKI
uniref:NAD(P)H-quinone oxidoreductase subunit 6, chloroplastic n=1 Tax=Staurastrum punctulatum TaxID=102822 RepID=NU6C_STAPU|nr:NADH dehydrogenase subunit 6 [Staurastrum punctulatum]Q32S04.1 RecName: Full=NAD(P)H-quinone oxidoreductase subunit 6, chloroplastic; AltName: Full=NAD(P)H dehydrogenase subunit 6; AltName: Full=NADH-plastoquinone oxidoreductase subunit 6 [Staurastrum punctulatum]AAX45703.1 subunit 6 of NADH-plastoquinone oxidoreductase [Staurastrum punctulatum]